MGDLTIGQIASKAKVNASTIRYYESIGLLPEPKRVNGQRRYSDEILNQIKFIKIAQQAGFTVQEIHTLLEGFEKQIPPSERWHTMAVSMWNSKKKGTNLHDDKNTGRRIKVSVPYLDGLFYEHKTRWYM